MKSAFHSKERKISKDLTVHELVQLEVIGMEVRLQMILLIKVPLEQLQESMDLLCEVQVM
jgi:hypothetical protein